ncbi:MAG: sn-glycerol-3-phosphate ABC transporter ATP-binding protein UgpC [Phycisphaerales bacterium]|nr:sn-glycerol-3-phosphate ABC transporter ATP-binding protein UgpC [Phycisphaerales bacterium]
MARVTLNNVSKTYPNGFKAVEDFTLEIADGEFVVFVGPSGCGKSTTLRLIAGLEEEFSGTIEIGGRVVNDVPPAQRDIAMVFQNYALYPHMTVYANMAMALKFKGVPKAETARRVREAAKFLEVDHLLDRKPGQLSGGQRQRVAVGRAIVREPKAFLFDEPLSNLDARLRVTTRAELKALHLRLRTTSIYVTHDQEEAMTLGDRIVVMAKGRIQQAAPPLEVYRRPVNRFVASFVGTPPMNFIDGVSVAAGGGGAGGGARLRSADGAVTLTLAGAPCGWAEERDPVAVGIRPHALSLRPVEGGSEIAAVVEATEFLGEQMDVQVRAGSQRLVARVPIDDGVKPGDRVTLYVRGADVMLFEPGEFGANLTL